MRGYKKNLLVDFIRKHKNLSNRSLAKLFMVEHEGVFELSEHCRRMIVKIRTTKKTDRGVIPVADLARTQEEIDGWKNNWRKMLPKPKIHPFLIYNLPSVLDMKYLFMCDAHVHYHDLRAMGCALEFGYKEKCNGVIWDGDMIDFYKISNFIKEMDKKGINSEREALFDIIKTTIHLLKPIKFIYKLGNHEKRMETYLMQHPGIEDLPELKPNMFFDVDKYGIELVPPNNPIRFGKLNILHGDEYSKGFIAPVNPARGMYLRANDSVIMGHRHVTSEHTEKTINNKIITCWSVGCLCDLHPEYSPFNKWNQGFGILSTQTNGWYKFQNYRIINGTVV